MAANLDLVRSWFRAWERGDYTSADWADPEIEYAFCDGPERGRWSGVAGMPQAWFKALDTWEDYAFTAEKYLELDDERVLVLTRACRCRCLRRCKVLVGAGPSNSTRSARPASLMSSPALKYRPVPVITITRSSALSPTRAVAASGARLIARLIALSSAGRLRVRVMIPSSS
jgi:hypothetical protein